MTERKARPEIRFDGFCGEWEQKNLALLVDYSKGQGYSKGDLRESGEPIVLYGRLYTKYETVISETDTFVSPKENSVFSKGNEVIVPASGETAEDIARASVIQNSGIILGGDLNILHPPPFIDATFLALSISNGALQKELARRAQGKSVVHIHNSDLYEPELAFPKKEEQKSISTLFLAIDRLVSFHQREYDKTLNLKRAMLEKMFPKDGADRPEVRFEGFTEAWEQKTIGAIVSIVERPIKLIDDEQYQLVTVKRRNDGVVSRGFLKGRDILVKSYFEIRAGDFLISKRQIVHGANGLVPKSLDKSVVSNEYLVVVSNDIISSEFWTLISKRKELYNLYFLSSYGVDIEKLVFDVDDWKKRVVLIPSILEQRKILEFFEKLDSLLTLHQKELTKLKNIKKALLEKMFV